MKTKITSILTKAAMMLLTVLLTMTAQTAWAATMQFPIYSGDEGTSEKPYQIKTIDDLNKLAADVNSGTNYLDKYFKLMNDLDFYEATNTALRPTTAWDDESSTENNYTAIGIYGKSFSGHFDGNNKTIRGLRIYTDNHYQGLFGNVLNAEIKDITLTDARLAGGYYIGGIVGCNTSGTVTNCHVRADVAIVAKNSGSCKGYGGIAGSNTGTVSYCTSAVKIAVADGANAASIGGIAGANTSSATLTDNFVIGAVIPAARYNTHAAIAVDENYTSAPYLVSYARNYYWDCTVAGTENATDVGIATYMGEKNVPHRDITDNDGAVRIYSLTSATGITASATATITYNGVGYYKAGTTVTLSGLQSAPELPAGSIYDEGYTVNGTAISGNTFNMPAGDVTVTSNITQCYTLTLAAGITAEATPTVTVSGTPYYRAGTTVTLSGRPTADGYIYPYLLNGTPLYVNTFTMPASNVTVTIGEPVADWQSQPGCDGSSEATAYQIRTTIDLELLAQRVNSGNKYVDKYFKLMNDIAYAHTTAWNDATSTENNYTAIGNNAKLFAGTFDGDGHTISGIRIYKGGSDASINSAIDSYQGLFGHVGIEGTVKNVTLTDARITGFENVGGIAGKNGGGTVTGCRVAGDVALHAVQNGAENFGGIVSYNSYGTVSGCTSSVKISAASGITGIGNFGGIVGNNFCIKSNDIFVGTITNCHAIGASVAASGQPGAIVGNYQVDNTSDNPLSGSGNTYHSCLVGGNAFNIGVGWYFYGNTYFYGDVDGAALDNTAFLLDDYMDAPALIAAYADPGSHTAISSTIPNVSSLTATLSRTFPAGKKQTVCLPFPPDALLNLGTVWEFTGISDGKAVMTQRTSDLQAHTPYIFEPTNDVTNPTFSDVKVTNNSDPKTVDATAGFTFHGTYTQKHWLATSDEVTQGTIYGFMAEDNDGQATGQFVRARRETFLRPFSCYLEYNGVLNDTNPTSQAPSLRSPIEALPDVIDIVWQPAVGSTTEITTTDFTFASQGHTLKERTPHSQRENYTDSDGAWFTLDGRKLEQQPTAKGVYIHGGRKVVIK